MIVKTQKKETDTPLPRENKYLVYTVKFAVNNEYTRVDKNKTAAIEQCKRHNFMKLFLCFRKIVISTLFSWAQSYITDNHSYIVVVNLNEHANRVDSLRAPEHLHYGKNQSLDFRVKATAAFLKKGRKY